MKKGKEERRVVTYILGNQRVDLRFVPSKRLCLGQLARIVNHREVIAAQEVVADGVSGPLAVVVPRDRNGSDSDVDVNQ